MVLELHPLLDLVFPFIEPYKRAIKPLKSFCLRDRGKLGNEGQPISLKIGTRCCYVNLCMFQLQ